MRGAHPDNELSGPTGIEIHSTLLRFAQDDGFFMVSLTRPPHGVRRLPLEPFDKSVKIKGNCST